MCSLSFKGSIASAATEELYKVEVPGFVKECTTQKIVPDFNKTKSLRHAAMHSDILFECIEQDLFSAPVHYRQNFVFI